MEVEYQRFRDKYLTLNKTKREVQKKSDMKQQGTFYGKTNNALFLSRTL
jgi:hypothetical protein